MDAILNLGNSIIIWLQSLGGWLVTPMSVFTFLGNEQFYLVVAPAIFWCLDTSLGLKMGLSLMVNTAFYSILKLVFHTPRPYWIEPRVQPFSAETSFGIPSGHSQNATVAWGLLAAWANKTWGWVIAGVLIFLIGLSRMYLGVHFPTDVLAGWAIGALVLWAILRYEKPLSLWLARLRPTDQILYALGASLGLILLGALTRLALNGWTMPAQWAELAARAPGAAPIDPLELSGLISNAGTFFGLALGGILLYQRGWFNARGRALQLLARYLIGLVGVLVLWYGLGAIFPRGESLVPYLLRYLRYFLIGLWVSGLAPMIFIRLKLAKTSA
jgi:membrane-associated phospholipid phosphatase